MREALAAASDALAAAGVEALLEHVGGTDRASLYSGRAQLTDEDRRWFGHALCRRAHGVPLEHLTGERRFFGLELVVRPGVFIPRPETEVVVEAALDAIAAFDRPTVIDVGTGSGAIALAIKHRRQDARVLATDVSGAAVELAGQNARRLGLDVEIFEGALIERCPADVRGRVDLVVSNPPYVEADEYEALPLEVKADPLDALVGGTSIHARLVGEALAWLAPGGWLVCEIGAEQGTAVRGLFDRALVGVEILPDLAGRERVARGRRPTDASVPPTP